MSLIKIPTLNTNLTLDVPQTFLVVDTTSSVAGIAVKNITGFAINQILIIGKLGNENSEIIKTSPSTAPITSSLGGVITLNGSTVFPHSSSTPVLTVQYDQIEYSTATTVSGAKTVLATVNIAADAPFTTYNDTAGSTGYYFARFKNSITSAFSAYSDAIPVTGYVQNSVRTVIDAAVAGINKDKQYPTDTLYDSFFIQELNNFQQEVKAELKRWSWLQLFDQVVTSATVGMWKFPVPTNLDDQNTNKSVYNLRLGTDVNMVWVDKARMNQLLEDVAYTTLQTAVGASDTTMTLADSNNFPESGTVSASGNSFAYSSNNQATGVLTLSAAAGTTVAAGVAVFSGMSLGQPVYWTTYGGNIYCIPAVSSDYVSNEFLMDFYSTLTALVNDTDQLVVPDLLCAQYYLMWKALRKLNNGEETEGSLSMKEQFEKRLQTLKNKEVMGRTFVMRPRINNWAKLTTFGTEDTPREVRDANFPNIGF